MKVGLVGAAGSGKTTIFNALTGLSAPTGDYGGGKVQLGTIHVPDHRLQRLSEIYQPKKVTRAELTCVDVPGAHGGAAAGLDSALLQSIRDVDALALIIGAFDRAAPNPVAEVESFESELILRDQILVERRMERREKKQEREALGRLLQHLQAEQPLHAMDIEAADRQRVRHYAFVSDKPLVVAINVDEASLESGRYDDRAQVLRERGYPAFVLSGQLEAELADIEDEDERRLFLEAMGLQTTARDQFIGAIYKALDLITFLTAGDKEVRAWPVPRGCKARRAAGKIHSDLERGFIRAEAFHFDEIDEIADETRLRSLGRLRIEGKDYVVQDGDVLLIRHS